ncbi:unnamed protein product [Bursaphelenchus xylophilus]|uniref:(pine wood nematode) hypothetical protein n=1 Tax=Bursaphelenchus xylophilus TaxID=6326 RepID=A0A1I7RIY6_BURXY|nr:unnamed protein product [Bursaphelenchus xylophilus]CAG9119178.1 unnamed protein product [Bursaphelenchus xylophilus]
MCAQKVAVLLLLCLVAAEAQYYYGYWPGAYYYGKRSAEAAEHVDHEASKEHADKEEPANKTESAEKVEKRSVEEEEHKKVKADAMPEFAGPNHHGEHPVPIDQMERRRFMMYVQNRPIQVPYAPVPYQYPQPQQQ